MDNIWQVSTNKPFPVEEMQNIQDSATSTKIFYSEIIQD